MSLLFIVLLAGAWRSLFRKTQQILDVAKRQRELHIHHHTSEKPIDYRVSIDALCKSFDR
jgi:hypothetical protein